MARILSTSDKLEHSQSDESVFVDNNTERGQEMVFHNNAFMKKTIQNRYGGILTRRTNNSKKNNDRNSSNKKSDTNSNRDSGLEKFFREHGKDIISSNRSMSTSFIRDIIKEEFPTSDNVVPSPTELVQFGNKEENDGSYKPGDWVGKFNELKIYFMKHSLSRTGTNYNISKNLRDMIISGVLI